MYIQKSKEIITKYYKQQLKKMVNGNFSYKDTHFLKIKYHHSLECCNIATKIIINDEELKNESDFLKQRIETACLLHDIGRFFELTNELNGKEHGNFGADLLKEKENFEDKLILIAIRHHDKIDLDLNNDKDYLTLSNFDKRNAKIISNAVRDADKISNLYLYKREKTVYTRKPKIFGYSPEYIQGLKEKHRIEKKYKKTIFDSIVYYIIWFHELIFDGSKKFVLKHKLIDHLINMYGAFINKISELEEENMTEKEISKQKYKMKRALVEIIEILKEQKVIKK